MFANDPLVPLQVQVTEQEDNSIGGMSPGGFAVLIIFLVFLFVAIAIGFRWWHKRKALEPLNQTEAELIKQTSAAKRVEAGKSVKSTAPKASQEVAPTILIATVEPLERELEPDEIPPLPATLPKGVSALAMTDAPLLILI